MIYKVRARFVDGKADEFHKLLTDGTIARQKPAGAEIVDSMKRATVGDDGVVQWTENCYCTPPLNHERTTVLDRFFSDMEIESVEEYATFSGQPFMEHIEEQ